MLVGTALFVALGLAMAGCTPSDGPDSRPTATRSASAAPVTPTPTASLTPTATPTPTDAVTPPNVDTSPPPAVIDTGAGCPANGIPIPVGAVVSAIEDVDGDNRADTQFFVENPEFAYGISTASGATYMLKDRLAGPNTHSGWSAPLESELVITVLDDGRTANLYTFTNCAFVSPVGADGNPYSVNLRGFGDTATGLECFSGNGGRWFYAVLATRSDSGRYTISRTSLDISRDGTTVVARDTEQIATDLAEDDPQVSLAMRSTCEDTPKVATSGR
jgi:hypothetical protein